MWFKVKSASLVFHSDEEIRRQALKHLAEVFGLPEASLSLDASFGEELKAGPVSDFKFNQFDIIDSEIKDVADKKILREMEQGILTIQNVRDYCEHKVRCNSINSTEVSRILKLP